MQNPPWRLFLDTHRAASVTRATQAASNTNYAEGKLDSASFEESLPAGTVDVWS
jgi:hypothetical protein